jgi:hypothetical protein
MKAKNFLPPLVILAAWVLFFRHLPDQIFIFRDSFPIFYPEWKFVAQVYGQGYFPLWNPYEYLGLPFLAVILPAAFYPLIAVFCLLPFDQGFTLFIALHFLLAGLFMWLLLRRLKLGQAACLIGAIAYMESGYLVSMQGTLNYLTPLPWLPLLLLAFDHLLDRPRFRSWLLAAALFAVPILVGDPQSELIWLLILLVWLRLRPASKRLPPRTALCLLAGLVAISGLLIAIQILPALELAPFSEKAAGYSFDEITRWSFNPLRAREWFFPWPGNLARSSSDWAMTTYFGLVPLLGLWFLFLYRRSRFSLGLASLAFFFLLLAFGRHTPVYKIFLLLPGMTSFRYPEKFLAPVTLLVIILAGLGLDCLERPPQPSSPRLLSRTAWLAAAGLLAVVALPRKAGFNPDHTLMISLLLAIVFLAQFLKPRLRPAVPYALILIAWLDLHTAHDHLLALAPISRFQDQPRAAQVLREIEPGDFNSFRIHRDPLFPTPVEAIDWTLTDRRRNDYDTLLPNRAMTEGLVEYLGYTPARPKWVPELAGISDRRLWSLAGVRYVLWGIDGGTPLGLNELEALEEVRRLPELNLVIFRDREALPRAFAVTGVRWTGNLDAKIFLMDTDLSRQVILPGAGENRAGGALTPARTLELSDQRAEVKIKLEQPGYLVLSDSYFPGWQARVNGRPERILRADYLLRAVLLPVGESSTVFLYRPWAFRLGLWASLVTLTGFIIGGAILGRPRRESAA